MKPSPASEIGLALRLQIGASSVRDLRRLGGAGRGFAAATDLLFASIIIGFGIELVQGDGPSPTWDVEAALFIGGLVILMVFPAVLFHRLNRSGLTVASNEAVLVNPFSTSTIPIDEVRRLRRGDSTFLVYLELTNGRALSVHGLNYWTAAHRDLVDSAIDEANRRIDLAKSGLRPQPVEPGGHGVS